MLIQILRENQAVIDNLVSQHLLVQKRRKSGSSKLHSTRFGTAFDKRAASSEHSEDTAEPFTPEAILPQSVVPRLDGAREMVSMAATPEHHTTITSGAGVTHVTAAFGGDAADRLSSIVHNDVNDHGDSRSTSSRSSKETGKRIEQREREGLHWSDREPKLSVIRPHARDASVESKDDGSGHSPDSGSREGSSYDNDGGSSHRHPGSSDTGLGREAQIRQRSGGDGRGRATAEVPLTFRGEARRSPYSLDTQLNVRHSTPQFGSDIDYHSHHLQPNAIWSEPLPQRSPGRGLHGALTSREGSRSVESRRQEGHLTQREMPSKASLRLRPLPLWQSPPLPERAGAGGAVVGGRGVGAVAATRTSGGRDAEVESSANGARVLAAPVVGGFRVARMTSAQSVDDDSSSDEVIFRSCTKQIM